MKTMCIDRLHEVLHCDPATGVLTWKKNLCSKARAGAVAGSFNKRRGYRSVRVDGTVYFEHRVIFAMTHGRWSDKYIDHINGDRADNRPCNLREATHGQNNVNTILPTKNSTGFKGVYFDKKRGVYRAKVGHSTYVGTFPSPELAHEAYKSAAKRIYGEFARAA